MSAGPLEIRIPAGLARSRRKRGAGVKHSARRAAPTRAAVAGERRTRRLPLPYWIEMAIDEGRLQDYAHAARVLGVSRARITQVMDMLLLPVAEQEAILVGDVGKHRTNGRLKGEAADRAAG